MRLILLWVLLMVNVVGIARNAKPNNALNPVNIELLRAKSNCTPTLSTGAIVNSTFCAGASISVPFTFTDCVDASNVFVAELSDAFGSFASPIIIGSMASTNAGSILATIPANITSFGSAYRIRVTASSPATIGSDNGADLTIIPRPNAGFTVNALAQCISTNNFIFSNTSTGSISSFNWSFGDGNTAISNNAANVYTNPGIYNVTLIATGSNGCKDSSVIPVSVNSKPIAGFNVITDNLCQGQTFSFTNTSTINIGSISYLWNFGDATNATSINAAHAYNSGGTFDVKLIALSNGGCVDSITKTVTVLPKETALFTANTLTQCGNSNFIFTNNTSGITTSFWSFGDGITSTLTSPAKSYTIGGTYNVKLVVTNVNGCKDSTTKTVTVLDKPNAAFNINGSLNCSNNSTFTFTNTSTGVGNTYLWSFGDGNTSNAISPSNTYSLEGTYIVQLLVINSNGCRDSISKAVTFSSNASASFVVNNTTQCVGSNSFVFTNTSNGNVVSSSWSFGDGITSTLTSPAKTYANAGTYTVKLIVTNNNGCKDSVSKTVTVSNKPTASFNTTGSINCSNNLTIQTINNSTGIGNTYLWNFGDGATSSLINPSHTYSLFGTYAVKLFVTNNNGCVDSMSRTITFTERPVASFNITSNTTQCLGGNSFTFDNGSIYTQTYLWSFGDGTTSTLGIPSSKTYSMPGTYIVKLVTTNINGCKDSVSQTVKVLNGPKAAFNAVYQNCGRLDVQFRQIDSASTVFSNWSFGDGNTVNNVSSNTHLYSTFGTYTVKFYAYDATSTCVDSAVKTIVLNPMPAAGIHNSTAKTQCLNNNSYTFTNNSLNATSYLWNFGNGVTSTLENPNAITYNNPGTYTISLTVSNNYGCSASTGDQVIVVANPKAAFNVAYQTCNTSNVVFTQIDTAKTVFSAWDFGDGSGASDVFKTTHSYTVPQTYTVKYYVYDGIFFCSDSAVKTITFSSKPDVIFFNNNNSKQCLKNNSFSFTNLTIGATSYLWDFGDGTTSTLATPAAKTYSSAGFYTIKLTATNANGCVTTSTILDTVLPQPTGTISANYQACQSLFLAQNLNTQFTQTTNFATKHFAWDFGDGTPLSLISNPLHTYPIGATNYTADLYLYDSNFYCSDKVSTTIKFLANPLLGITTTSSSIQCFNTNSFSFGDAYATASSYLWNFGDGATAASVTSGIKKYNNPGTYTVTEIATSANGCKDSAKVTIRVVPSPKADFTATILQPCGFDVQFIQTDSSNTPISSWDFGDGNFDIDKSSVTHSYATAGTYTVKFYAFDTAVIYCEDSVIKTITINPKPVASFAVNNSTQCLAGNAFSFANTSLNGVSYLWYFGDGSFSTQQTPSPKVYTNSGIYTVKQIVTNVSGCKDSITHTVSVQQNPIAAFTATYTSCNNLTVQFAQTNTVNTVFSAWDFGDGSGLSDVFTASHTYATTGTYIVKYYAYDASFTCVDSATKTITLSSNPTANFLLNSLPQCENNNSITPVNSSLNASSYYWTFGNGSFSFAVNPTVTYTNAGVYNIKLVAINSNGCKDSITKSVTILSKPVPSFNIVGNASCSGSLSVSLDNTTNGVNTYLWNFGDGETSTAASVTKVYAAYGTYNIKLIVTTPAGCKDSLVKQVILAPKVIASFNVSSNGQCLNSIFNFTNTSSNYTSNIWYFGDGSFSTQASPTHNYAFAGVYLVKLIVTNSNGCKDSSTTTITINTKPTAGFSIGGNTNCTSNKTINIVNTAIGAANYYYDFGDGTNSSNAAPTHTYTSNGTYTVKQIVSNSNGCKDSVIKLVTFTSLPTAAFTVNSNTQCLNGNVFSFVNNSVNAVSNIWNFGDGTNSTNATPTHSYLSAGVYTVKLVVSNASGCKDSVVSIVTVLPKPLSSFNILGATGCTNNRTITISSTAIGATTYFYDFGDGTTSNTVNPSKTFATTGIYIIKQVVTNANGCKDSSTQTISFGDYPVAAFTLADPVTQCLNGNSFSFVNSSVNAIDYVWNFGDGTSVNQTNPTQTYSSSGNFTITLIAISTGGCKDSASININVLAKPTAAFGYSGSTNCTNNRTINITSNAVGAINHFYDFGDGTTSTLTNPSKTYTTAGTFVIKQVVTNANGCRDSVYKTVNFTAPVTAAFTAVAGTNCSNSLSVNINNTSVNATAYNWNFGDGTTSTLINPSKTYVNAGTYIIKLVAVNAGGCKDSITQSIIVTAKPIANFVIPNFNNCSAGNTFAFSNTSTNAVTYSWSFGDGGTSTLVSPSHTYATTGTYNIKLVATAANGCVDSTIKTISFVTKPTASFTTVASTSCNNSFTFNNTSVNNAASATYYWTFGDASFSFLQNPVKAYTNAGTYTVVLVVTNSNGCKDTTSQIVTVSPKPVAAFNLINFNSCNNSNTISAQSTSTNVVSMNWNFGDGTTATGANVIKTYTTGGTYVITLVVTNANGCADSTSKTITLSAKPTASFTTNSVAQCVNNNQFVFNNTSSISVGTMQYNWSFGDGTNSTSTNPVKVFSSAGTYSVKLIVTNGVCNDTATSTVTVLAKPSSLFTIVPSSLCSNNKTISFNNTSSNIASFVWNFGDGNTSSLYSPSNTFTNYGTYTVSLITKNTIGCSDTLTQAVNVAALPTAVFSVNNVTQCLKNNSFNFTNTSLNATTNNWNFGDGVGVTTTSPTHTYTAIGTYVVSLKTSNINGCIDSAKTTVVVNPSATANFAYSGATNCTNNLTLVFNNQSTGNNSYLWNFGDGVNSSVVAPTHTYSVAGTYTITLTAINASGCSDSVSQTVTFEPKPIANFTIVGGTQCVNSNAYSFNNTSLNGLTYLWNFGDGTTSTLQSPTHSYTTAGNYNVSLVVTGNAGCSATTNNSLTVAAVPVVSFTLGNFNACVSNSVSLTNTTTGATNYTWDFGNGILSNQTNPTVTYSTAGVYTITLTATNASSCSSSASQKVTLLDKPVSSFTLVSATTQCVGNNSYAFVNNSTNASTYLWNFGDGTTSALNSPTHTYTGSGIFTVTLTVTNVNGCTATSSTTISLLAKPTASFNISNYNSCIDNKTINPINTSTNANSYVWNFGDGILSAVENPVHTYTNAGTYVVTLIASNGNGCLDTIKKTITITNKPVSLFGIGGNSIQCLNGNSFTFVNYSTNAATSVWDFGDGTTATANNTSHTYSTAGTYTITLTVTSATGCTATSAQTVTVNVKPNASFTINNINQCLTNNLFSFTNTSVNIASVNYLWNFGDSNYTVQTNATKAYANAGNYTVTLTATDANGCVDSAVKVVSVYGSLVTGFEISTSTSRQCTDSTLLFKNNTKGTASEYLWRFGDGTTSNLTNPLHKFAASGSYTVTLIAKNLGGCIDSISQTILIGNKPTANFTATSANVCNSVYDFVSTSTGNIISYVWKFADTSINAGSNLSRAFLVSGNNDVKLIAYSAPGCADSIVKSVNVLAKPTVAYTQNAVVGCINDNSFTFISRSSAGSLSVSNDWSFGDGTFASGVTVNKSYTTAGTYNVKLVSTINATGCKDSITQTVTVYPKPTGIISGSIAVCKGTSAILTLTLTGKPPFSVAYTDGSSNFSINDITTNTYSFSVVPDVTKTYRLISVKDAICTATEADLSSNATVTIHTLTYTKQPENVATCLGKDVMFTSTAFSNTIFTYQWFKNGIAIPGATKDTLLLTNVSTLDNGYYKLAAVLACGSFTSNTVTLRVDPLPPAPVYTSSYLYCQYDTAKPLVANGTVIKWYDNATTGLGSTVPPTPSTKVAGITQYWVTNTTLPTCETQRFAVTAIVLPAPTIVAKVTGPTTLIPTQTATLTATASANTVGVKWYKNAAYIGLTPGNKVVVDYANPGTYYAEAITSDGCKARTDSIVIKANAGGAPSLNVNNLLLYPNPTRSFINMYFNNPVNENVRIRIVNMVGQIIKEMPFKYTMPSQIVKMDVTGLHPETYVVEVVDHLGTTIARNLFVKVD